MNRTLFDDIALNIESLSAKLETAYKMLFVFEEFLDGEINPIPIIDTVHSLPVRHDLISAQLHGIEGILMDITEDMDALASKIDRSNESKEAVPEH